jgi:predicted amidohydrolase YtcJ
MERVSAYHHAGYQLAIHANGDAAIDDVLHAIRAAQVEFPREDARHRIEHCQTPREDQLDQMLELGITPSFFVGHVYYWGDRHAGIFLGPDRASRISPLASAAKRGIRFTIHNDTPVTPVDPLLLVWCSVTRTMKDGRVLGAEQRISAYAALRAVTLDAAWQNFEEQTKGSLEPGKLADLVVLAENPFTVPPTRLRDIEILETIVAGETRFRK